MWEEFPRVTICFIVYRKMFHLTCQYIVTVDCKTNETRCLPNVQTTDVVVI